MNKQDPIQKPGKNLVDFFKESPLGEIELELERNTDLSREVDGGNEMSTANIKNNIRGTRINLFK